MQYYSISCEKFLNLLIIWNQQREPKHEKIEMSMPYEFINASTNTIFPNQNSN